MSRVRPIKPPRPVGSDKELRDLARDLAMALEGVYAWTKHVPTTGTLDSQRPYVLEQLVPLLARARKLGVIE